MGLQGDACKGVSLGLPTTLSVATPATCPVLSRDPVPSSPGLDQPVEAAVFYKRL